MFTQLTNLIKKKMERFKKETFTENYFSNFELLGKDNNDDETDVSLKHLMYFRHMVV